MGITRKLEEVDSESEFDTATFVDNTVVGAAVLGNVMLVGMILDAVEVGASVMDIFCVGS